MPTKQEEAQKQVENLSYTPDEVAYRDYLIQRLTKSYNQRNSTHVEFDDMDYLTQYEKNAKAANSYIPPKLNKEDTRVVTGTTGEKSLTLLSALLNFNLEPNIVAYDQNDQAIDGLGETMEALLKKSRQIEDYDSKRVLIYKELLDQGTVFVEEQYREQIKYKRESKVNFKDGVDFKKRDWKKIIEDVEKSCEVNLHSGTKVYLGNIKEFDVRKQPYIFFHETMHYDEAKSIFKNWARWNYVPRHIVRLKSDDQDIPYQDWTLQELEGEMVEIIKYQDKWSNEMMIMINGVLMLPVGFPLDAISPSGEYTIAKGDAEPISKFFAYSKSIPVKTKNDQQVLDEMLKLIILKTQKSFAPPMSNRTNQILSKRIFMPGRITPNIDPSLLQPIGDATGVTPAEFSAFEFVKKIVDEKSLSPTFSGNQTTGQVTATEILEVKKQQMMKMGLLIYGVVSLEMQLAWLRIHNILEYWTREIDEEVDEVKGGIKKVYRTINVETTFDDGNRGTQVVSFNPELANSMTPERIKAEEDFLSEGGKPVRITYLSPEEMRVLKAKWFITITPTEKDSNELNRILFVQNIRDAAEIFGIQALNPEYLKQRFSILAKEDPDKFFLKQAPPQGQGQPLGQGIKPPQGGSKGGDIAAQLKASITPALKEAL